jgi:putative transposon-encoded protein
LNEYEIPVFKYILEKTIKEHDGFEHELIEDISKLGDSGKILIEKIYLGRNSLEKLFPDIRFLH